MDELEARIEALERAVTNGDHDLSELAAEGETRERLATVEAELDEMADQVAALEAATQALRGYVGNVRAVNQDIEQRADAALAKAESLESAIADDPRTDQANGQGGVPADGEARNSAVASPSTASDRADGGPHEGGTASGETDGQGHCRACGRPTRTETAGGLQVSAGNTGTDDPLEGVFEDDSGHKNGDDGTFDRIRQML